MQPEAGAKEADVKLVEALAIYESWAPERFTGHPKNDPVFAFTDEKVVTRADVQKVVIQAAVPEGADPNDMGSHSLGIGGASALYAAY